MTRVDRPATRPTATRRSRGEDIHRYAAERGVHYAALCALSLAAAGDLDHTFDSDGLVITPFGVASFETAEGVAIDKRGKIVAAGGNGDGRAAAGREVEVQDSTDRPGTGVPGLHRLSHRMAAAKEAAHKGKRR